VPTPDASNDPTTLQNNIASSNSVSIYPNPANDMFYVAGSKWQSLKIIDITGKIIMIIPSFNSGNQAINISNLEKGIYLIQLSNNNKIYTKHLIKN
jgi:hypothetical protein